VFRNGLSRTLVHAHPFREAHCPMQQRQQQMQRRLRKQQSHLQDQGVPPPLKIDHLLRLLSRPQQRHPRDWEEKVHLEDQVPLQQQQQVEQHRGPGAPTAVTTRAATAAA